MNETRLLNAHLWERHPLDFYVEPYWVSMRLFEEVQFSGAIHDPACGLGRIVMSAHDLGLEAWGTDKVRRSHYCRDEIDFLSRPNIRLPELENIVSNPPFGIAEQFVKKALELAAGHVAMLLPAKWLYGDKRSRWLEQTPLWKVLAITPRPSMPPGPVIEAGIAPGGGKEDSSFYIWKIGHQGPWTGGWLRRDG